LDTLRRSWDPGGNHMTGGKAALDLNAMPAVVFTDRQVAAFG
jgi:hypothetical protein